MAMSRLVLINWELGDATPDVLHRLDVQLYAITSICFAGMARTMLPQCICLGRSDKVYAFAVCCVLQPSRKERGPDPISLPACYARTPEELELFASSPDNPAYLNFEEALSAFHGTTIPAGTIEFEYKGYYWQLQQRETPDGKRTVYLALPAASSSLALSKPSSGACTPRDGFSRQGSAKQQASSPLPNPSAFYHPDTSPGLTPREGSYFMGGPGYSGSPGYHATPSYHYDYHSGREFWGKINMARSSGANADERYNAIMWLIDVCKERAQVRLGKQVHICQNAVSHVSCQGWGSSMLVCAAGTRLPAAGRNSWSLLLVGL